MEANNQEENKDPDNGYIESYKDQDACQNCKHFFQDYDDSGGSCWFWARKAYERKYKTPWGKNWDMARRIYRKFAVGANGICDAYEKEQLN